MYKAEARTYSLFDSVPNTQGAGLCSNIDAIFMHSTPKTNLENSSSILVCYLRGQRRRHLKPKQQIIFWKQKIHSHKASLRDLHLDPNGARAIEQQHQFGP